MLNNRFSLMDAYSFGVKSVLNNFTFFLTTMAIGAASTLAFLSILGMMDYRLFKEHFESIFKVFSHALQEPTGSVHFGNTTVHDYVRTLLPSVIAKHLSPRDIVSIDISGKDLMNLLQFLVPVALVFKLFLTMLSIGWTKVALDSQSNKKLSPDYFYKFYEFVPRVFIVEILVLIVTSIGLMLFLVPGIFLYERLRFARYFVIDKNQSIIKSLESSWTLTDGSVVNLSAYTIFSSFLSSIGRIIFVATFFLVPLGYQAEAHVYRQMVK